MMRPVKAKIFAHCTTDISPPGELQINEWLEENPTIEILYLLQSESMTPVETRIERNLTITVLYREQAGS
jgi:hypothetical protein